MAKGLVLLYVFKKKHFHNYPAPYHAAADICENRALGFSAIRRRGTAIQGVRYKRARLCRRFGFQTRKLLSRQGRTCDCRTDEKSHPRPNTSEKWSPVVLLFRRFSLSSDLVSCIRISKRSSAQGACKKFKLLRNSVYLVACRRSISFFGF